MRGKYIVALLLMFAVVSLSVLPMAAAQTKTVPGREQEKKLTNRVMPVYPPEAKAAGHEGTVRLQVLIAADGSVETVKVISGSDEFVQSAVDAVKQWKYEPTHVNGKPVPVKTDVDVNYKLGKK